MKIYWFFIVLICVSVFIPADTFSSMHENSVDQHYCALACSTACHSAIVPDHNVYVVSGLASIVKISYKFSHDNPFLPNIGRPPKVSL